MKRPIFSPSAASPIGPYRQAVVSGNMIFCSGQIPLDPVTGKLVDGDVEAQTRRVMENLQAILRAAGASLEHVVRTTIFLADIKDFERVNAVYGGYFPGTPPSRSTVAVASLPRGARLEIDAIAVLEQD